MLSPLHTRPRRRLRSPGGGQLGREPPPPAYGGMRGRTCLGWTGHGAVTTEDSAIRVGQYAGVALATDWPQALSQALYVLLGPQASRERRHFAVCGCGSSSKGSVGSSTILTGAKLRRWCAVAPSRLSAARWSGLR